MTPAQEADRRRRNADFIYSLGLVFGGLLPIIGVIVVMAQ